MAENSSGDEFSYYLRSIVEKVAGVDLSIPEFKSCYEEVLFSKARQRANLVKKLTSLSRDNADKNEEISQEFRALYDKFPLAITDSRSEVSKAVDDWLTALSSWRLEEKKYHSQVLDRLVKSLKIFGVDLPDSEIKEKIEARELNSLQQGKLTSDEKTNEWGEVILQNEEVLRIEAAMEETSNAIAEAETFQHRNRSNGNGNSEEDIEAAFLEYKRNNTTQDEVDETMQFNEWTYFARIKQYVEGQYKKNPKQFLVIASTSIIFFLVILIAIFVRLSQRTADDPATLPGSTPGDATTASTTICIPDGPGDVC